MHIELKTEILKLCRENPVYETATGYEIYRSPLRISMNINPLSYFTAYYEITVRKNGTYIYSNGEYVSRVLNTTGLTQNQCDLLEIEMAMTRRANENNLGAGQKQTRENINSAAATNALNEIRSVFGNPKTR